MSRRARAREAAEGVRVERELKRDALGRVELLARGSDRWIRRVACGGALPGSALVARALLRREARALEALEGLAGVPRRTAAAGLAAVPTTDGRRPDPRAVLVREHVAGAALHEAEELPADFFERLRELVQALHARGVCHNDLHKEQNVLVRADGRPALIDFQLASVHPRRGRTFESRVHDDLRHVEKHWRRYTRDGRGLEGTAAAPGAPTATAAGPAVRRRRTWISWLWRRTAKPLYNAVTRGLLRTRDGEPRRESSGPWPRWVAPVGPEDAGPASGTPTATARPARSGVPGE